MGRPRAGRMAASSVLELTEPRAVTHQRLLQPHEAPRVAAGRCGHHMHCHVQRSSQHDYATQKAGKSHHSSETICEPWHPEGTVGKGHNQGVGQVGCLRDRQRGNHNLAEHMHLRFVQRNSDCLDPNRPAFRKNPGIVSSPKNPRKPDKPGRILRQQHPSPRSPIVRKSPQHRSEHGRVPLELEHHHSTQEPAATEDESGKQSNS
mmetsp:Transcript_93945/g.251461  ORF Transcript_93945/g.251461 Transcript_93945/m.251461 type:complete len:205 (-) Transcript_93945:1880-2494(-)